MDSSEPTILPPQVRVPSTQWFYHLPIVKFVPYKSFNENENKQKEAGFGPFKKLLQS